jgi:hypothetical protein
LARTTLTSWWGSSIPIPFDVLIVIVCSLLLKLVGRIFSFVSNHEMTALSCVCRR